MKLGYLAAGLALVGMAAQAAPNEKGKGQGKGNAQAQMHNQGGGNAKAKGAGKPDGKGKAAAKPANGNSANRASGPAAKAKQAGQGNGKRSGVMPVVDRRGDRRDGRHDDFRFGHRDRHGGGLIAGCPPGLAKKHNGCLPPGQAKKRLWQRTGWFGYRSGSYRYLDGYLLRLGRDGRISGYEPLLGGILRIGNVWPDGQRSYALPDYYRNYYGVNDGYRSYGNAVYRVDPETAAITSIAALLTGQDVTVGQPMPRGYDVYNVPYSYRSQYRDGPDAYYRYNDGYIYQLDPETRLVQAAIELLI
ncbi:hypothetical protein [Altererythrobacter sp.]|uniref:hypothetical protein n=1 Tax=Altererythrobacter sp. TaxID=1872480 RepID=UPI003D0549D3